MPICSRLRQRKAQIWKKIKDWDLTFEDKRQEQGFLDLRKPRLARALKFMAISMIPLEILVLMYTLGNTFRDNPIFPMLGTDEPVLVKVMRVRGGFILGLACVGTVNSGLLMWSCVIDRIPARYLEAYIVLCASILPLVLVLVLPWNSAKLSGIDPWSLGVEKGRYEADEATLAMWLDCVVTISHFFLPLRSSSIWAVGASAWLSYLGAPMILGFVNPQFSFWNAIILLGLFLTAYWATHAMEKAERDNFLVLISERELRYRAQFQLDEVNKDARPKKPRNADELSVATTTQTDVLWSTLFAGKDLSEGLLKLAQVGMSEHWLLAPNSLKMSSPPQLLGAGSFGMVLAATYFESPVAVKLNKQIQGMDVKRLRSVAQELRVLRHVRHPFIVSLYGACIDPQSHDVILVLERLFGTPLSTLLRVRFEQVGMTTRIKLMKEVCGALQFMHNRHPRVVHGDLKGSNVVAECTGSGPVAKLVDFGLSRLITRSATPLGGTLKYMAPEVILARESPDSELMPAPSTDVFSFGRLLFLAIARRLPLEKISAESVVVAARHGQVLPLTWPSSGQYVEDAAALTDMCTRFRPDERVTIEEALHILQAWSSTQKKLSDEPSTIEGEDGSSSKMPKAPSSVSTPIIAGSTNTTTLSEVLRLARSIQQRQEQQQEPQQQQQQQQQQPPPLPQEPEPEQQHVRQQTQTQAQDQHQHQHQQKGLPAEGGPPAAWKGAQPSPNTRPTLPFPNLPPTPALSMELTLLEAMQSWNCFNNLLLSCCPFHGALQCLEEVRNRLLHRPCHEGFQPNSDWQCPDCLTMERIDGTLFPKRSIARCRLCTRLGDISLMEGASGDFIDEWAPPPEPLSHGILELNLRTSGQISL